MYAAWHDEDYGFMLTDFEVEGLGRVWAETKGWLDPERTPVVRLQTAHEPYYEMPAFTLNGEPLCHCESLTDEVAERLRKWILDNRVALVRHWEGLTDSGMLIKGVTRSVLDPKPDDEDPKEKVLQVEKEIKSLVGNDPFRFYGSRRDDATYDLINDLLSERARYLNRLFRCTPDDVKRVEQVNETLLGLCNSMIKRTGRLYRSTMAARDEAFDDDYEFEGELKVEVDFDESDRETQTDVLHLADDDYYGSDFYYMASVIQENEERHQHSYDTILTCHAVYNRANPDPNATDEEIELTNHLDDGQSWIHPFRFSELDHICICYAIHDMLDHHNWSWPDLLRINSYWVDVKAVCQRITDQKASRYKDIINDDDYAPE